MEPSKKNLKLDKINLNNIFQNLTLKRKNDIISDEKINKKVKLNPNKDKLEMKRKLDYDEIDSDKIDYDKNKINKINKKVKLELKSCGQEYAEYNKIYNNEYDDPDNESIKEYKRLPPDDIIYTYII